MAKGDKHTFEDTLDEINKKYGKGSIMKLSDNTSMAVERISTGSFNIDYITGGGLPMGRIVEIYGPESSGKTTLTLHAVAEAQKAYPKKYAAFIDAEHALDPVYAEALGVDLDRLLITQPDTGEQGLEIAEALIRSGDVSIVVVDSVDALTPEATINGEMGDTNIARLARLMSQGLRKLSAAVSKTNTLLIFVNQVREKVGVMFGNPETTPGGRALKFYASIRLRIAKQEPKGQKLPADGNLVSAKVRCIKNKVARPFLETFITIEFGKGILLMSEILDKALELEIVEKSGGWHSFNGVKIGNGRVNVINKLKSDVVLTDAIHDAINVKNNSR